MPDTIVDHLARIDLFHGLSRRELKRLGGAAREVQHPAGHTVVDEGKTGLGFHLIVAGHATVTTPRGATRELGPGDYFGEISLIDGLPRSATVVADDALRTVYLNASAFNALLTDSPEIAKSMLMVLCRRLRDLEQA